MPIKINGATSGSTTITAPATGSDETIELSTALASKQADVMTTKGDLAAYGTAVARLGVGTNGQVLTADSGETLGVKWADAAGGLTLIADDTFSAVSSVSLNGCFSSTYTNYLLMLRLSASSAANFVRWRLRASGVDATTLYFAAQVGYTVQNTSSNIYASTVNAGYLAETSATSVFTSVAATFYSPFAANFTSATISAVGNNTANTIVTSWTGGGAHGATTSYDGITLFPDSGTISGTVRVYGYKD